MMRFFFVSRTFLLCWDIFCTLYLTLGTVHWCQEYFFLLPYTLYSFIACRIIHRYTCNFCWYWGDCIQVICRRWQFLNVIKMYVHLYHTQTPVRFFFCQLYCSSVSNPICVSKYYIRLLLPLQHWNFTFFSFPLPNFLPKSASVTAVTLIWGFLFSSLSSWWRFGNGIPSQPPSLPIFCSTFPPPLHCSLLHKYLGKMIVAYYYFFGGLFDWLCWLVNQVELVTWTLFAPSLFMICYCLKKLHRFVCFFETVALLFVFSFAFLFIWNKIAALYILRFNCSLICSSLTFCFCLDSLPWVLCRMYSCFFFQLHGYLKWEIYEAYTVN